MSDNQAISDETQNLLPTHTSANERKQSKDWKYYAVWLWRFCIFAITGSSSVHVTRSLLKLLHCPSDVWYYYVAFFFLELAVYTVMIVLIGSLLFQWRFFCLVAFKMWSWCMPPKVRTWCFEHLHSHRISL